MTTQTMYDFVVERLNQSKGHWPAVASGSGVPKRTLEKIARKETADPRGGTLQKLWDYFHKLAFGVANTSEWLSDDLISMCMTYRDAVRMCWECRRVRGMSKRSLCELAGLTPQHVSDYLASDDDPGRRSLPAAFIGAFEATCGNRAITQWEMRQRGLTIMEEVISRKAS